MEPDGRGTAARTGSVSGHSGLAAGAIPHAGPITDWSRSSHAPPDHRHSPCLTGSGAARLARGPNDLVRIARYRLTALDSVGVISPAAWGRFATRQANSIARRHITARASIGKSIETEASELLALGLVHPNSAPAPEDSATRRRAQAMG
jgi:hypothetical protein